MLKKILMPVRLRSIMLGMTAVCLLFQNAGCFLVVGAAGGAGGTVYVMGKLNDQLKAPVPKVRQATLAALKDLGLPVRSDVGDKLTTHVESEFSDGTRGWIDIEDASDAGSKLKIRVGLLGDEAKSRKSWRRSSGTCDSKPENRAARGDRAAPGPGQSFCESLSI